MNKIDRDCILVVDDEEWIDEIIEEMLRRQEICEISHMNPESALTFFEENHQKLGLAIVDLTMPKMTGVELSRRFLVTDPEVPVILMTGHLIIPSEAQSIPNVKTVLLKPVSKQELLDTVKMYVPTGKSG